MMILIAAAAMALAPLTASAARVVVVGGGFRGPLFGPGYYYSYWGPYETPGYIAYAGLGELKIDTKSKEDEIFINGAFAGSTRDSKTFHLRPGTYTVEVRQGGQPQVNEQVFMAAGKTLHVRLPN